MQYMILHQKSSIYQDCSFPNQRTLFSFLKQHLFKNKLYDLKTFNQTYKIDTYAKFNEL